MTDEHWTAKAACVGEEKIFFSYKPEEMKQAKDICAECPVRFECIQDALDIHERFGMRGGHSEVELRVAQGINSKGEAAPHPNRRTRCLYCGPRSTRFLEIVERKRTKTFVRCTQCGLEWSTRRVVNRAGTNL